MCAETEKEHYLYDSLTSLKKLVIRNVEYTRAQEDEREAEK